MKNLDKLSVNSVFELHRKKITAKQKNDNNLLKELESQYPELFSEEFEKFISEVSLSIYYIKNTTGHDFRAMIEGMN